MNHRGWKLIILLLVVFSLTAASGNGETGNGKRESLTVNRSEKFLYDLTWTGINAGTASLEFTQDGDKRYIVSTAHSAKWVSVFYTVEDFAESIMIDNRASNYRIRQREGRYRSNKEVVFKQDRGKAIFYNHLNGQKEEHDVPRDVLDPLSGFYKLRTEPLEIGRPTYIEMFDTKKVWKVEVQVLRKERLSTAAGQFDTIVVKPLLQSAEGFFQRKGDVYIWLTDDSRRLPVKMQTKVVVGYVTATLVGGDF